MSIISLNFNAYENISQSKEVYSSQSKGAESSSLALVKAKAISEFLGYGIDKHGYFTSDFNEAAKLPLDYKIDSKMLVNTLNLYSKTGFYNEIDIAKSFANAYEDFTNSNVLQSANKGKALTRHFLAYRKDFLEGQSSFMGKIFGFDKNVSSKHLQDFQSFMDKNRIRNDFLNPNNLINPSLDLKANLSSKEILSLGGMRFTVSEYEDLMTQGWNFAFDEISFDIALKSTNKFYKEFSPLISEISKDYKELLHSSLSLEEFKQEYIKLKERFDDFIAKIKEAHQKKLENELSNSNALNVEDKKEESLTVIEAKSEKESYEKAYNLELLKTKHNKDLLELIFNQKVSTVFKEINIKA